MGEVVHQLFWPRGLAGKLGRLLGAMSIVALLQQSLLFGPGPAIERVLEYYDRLIVVAIGWAEPPIRVWLVNIGHRFHWDLVLYSHWKHVFVLMGIYFFRGAEINFRQRLPATAIFNITHGFATALISSVVSGAIRPHQFDISAQFWIAAIPLLGAQTNTLIGFMWDATFLREFEAARRREHAKSWLGHFLWGLGRVLPRIVIGLIIIWLGLHIPWISRLNNAGLAMLVILVVIFAFYWLVEGLFEALRSREIGEPFIVAYQKSGYTQLGIAMIGTFFIAGVIVLGNAGLQYFGL